MQIKAISTYLPEKKITNEELANQFNVPAEEIFKKTGVLVRCHTSIDINMQKMAEYAAIQLFDQVPDIRSQIDALILVGHGFSYKAPNTSAILQHLLQLPKKCYCIDLPHGCTGYIYGLSIAHSLIQSKITKNILLLTADTPSYGIRKDDLELLSIFGDSATATFITHSNTSSSFEKFIFYTDGSGYDKLIVERSGTINPADLEYYSDKNNPPHGIMKMDGTAIFLMSIKLVPNMIYETLEKNNLSINDIDYFVFHQANSFMLEVLRKKLKIPKEKFFNDIRYTGNTVSSSIPIALHQLIKENKLHRGMKLLLAGFGLGYTLGATVIEF